MAWYITDSVDEFLAGAGGFLRARPVENTVLLTVTDTLRQRGSQTYGDGPPVFGWRDDGAFVRTPPRGALSSEMPPGADDVVLFADRSNPTSNALYQRLGYTPIEDRQTVEFPS